MTLGGNLLVNQEVHSKTSLSDCCQPSSMTSCLDMLILIALKRTQSVRADISDMFLFGKHRPPGFGCCSRRVCFPHKIFMEQEVLTHHVGVTIRVSRRADLWSLQGKALLEEGNIQSFLLYYYRCLSGMVCWCGDHHLRITVLCCSLDCYTELLFNLEQDIFLVFFFSFKSWILQTAGICSCC